MTQLQQTTFHITTGECTYTHPIIQMKTNVNGFNKKFNYENNASLEGNDDSPNTFYLFWYHILLYKIKLSDTINVPLKNSDMKHSPHYSQHKYTTPYFIKKKNNIRILKQPTKWM
jgi:hypothetical protein